jgi:tetratricopeptide (TPR) repeat protein
MAKVIKFPGPAPEKFGLQRVEKKKEKKDEKQSQLPLFGGAKIVKFNPLTPFEDALLQDEHHQLNAAKELYEKAIAAGDSQADAYCNLGIIEFEQSNRAKAIDCFTQCLKIDPRHYEAHYNLANLYAEAGNYALAKFHYGISIEIEPSFPNSYFNLGLTLAMNKEFKEAVKMLMTYRSLTSPDDHQYTDDLLRHLDISRLD